MLLSRTLANEVLLAGVKKLTDGLRLREVRDLIQSLQDRVIHERLAQLRNLHRKCPVDQCLCLRYIREVIGDPSLEPPYYLDIPYAPLRTASTRLLRHTHAVQWAFEAAATTITRLMLKCELHDYPLPPEQLHLITSLVGSETQRVVLAARRSGSDLAHLLSSLKAMADLLSFLVRPTTSHHLASSDPCEPIHKDSRAQRALWIVQNSPLWRFLNPCVSLSSVIHHLVSLDGLAEGLVSIWQGFDEALSSAVAKGGTLSNQTAWYSSATLLTSFTRHFKGLETIFGSLEETPRKPAQSSTRSLLMGWARMLSEPGAHLPAYWLRELWRPQFPEGIRDRHSGLVRYLVSSQIGCEAKQNLFIALCNVTQSLIWLLYNHMRLTLRKGSVHQCFLSDHPNALRGRHAALRQSAVIGYLIHILWEVSLTLPSTCKDATKRYLILMSQLCHDLLDVFNKTLQSLDLLWDMFPWGGSVSQSIDQRACLQSQARRALTNLLPLTSHVNNMTCEKLSSDAELLLPWTEAITAVAIVIRPTSVPSEVGQEEGSSPATSEGEDYRNAEHSVSAQLSGLDGVKPIDVQLVEMRFSLISAEGGLEIWVRKVCHLQEGVQPASLIGASQLEVEATPVDLIIGNPDSLPLCNLDISGMLIRLPPEGGAFLLEGCRLDGISKNWSATHRSFTSLGVVRARVIGDGVFQIEAEAFKLASPSPSVLAHWYNRERDDECSVVLEHRNHLRRLSALAQEEWISHLTLLSSGVFNALLSVLDFSLSPGVAKLIRENRESFEQSPFGSTLEKFGPDLLQMLHQRLRASASIPLKTALGELNLQKHIQIKTTARLPLSKLIATPPASAKYNTGATDYLSVLETASDTRLLRPSARLLPLRSPLPTINDRQVGRPFFGSRTNSRMFEDLVDLRFCSESKKPFEALLRTGLLLQAAAPTRVPATSLCVEAFARFAGKALRRCLRLLPEISSLPKAFEAIEQIHVHAATIASLTLRQGRSISSDFLVIQAESLAALSHVKQKLKAAMDDRRSANHAWIQTPLLPCGQPAHLRSAFPSTRDGSTSLWNVYGTPSTMSPAEALQMCLWSHPILSTSCGSVLVSTTVIPLRAPSWWKLYIPHPGSFELDVLTGSRVIKMITGRMKPSSSSCNRVFHFGMQQNCDANSMGTAWKLTPSNLIQQAMNDFGETARQNCTPHGPSPAVLDILIIPQPTQRSLVVRAGGRVWRVGLRFMRRHRTRRRRCFRDKKSHPEGMEGRAHQLGSHAQQLGPHTRLRQRLKRCMTLIHCKAKAEARHHVRQHALSLNAEMRLCVITPSDGSSTNYQLAMYDPADEPWTLADRVAHRAWVQALEAHQPAVRTGAFEEPTHGRESCSRAHDEQLLPDFREVCLVRTSVLPTVPVSARRELYELSLESSPKASDLARVAFASPTREVASPQLSPCNPRLASPDFTKSPSVAPSRDYEAARAGGNPTSMNAVLLQGVRDLEQAGACAQILQPEIIAASIRCLRYELINTTITKCRRHQMELARFAQNFNTTMGRSLVRLIQVAFRPCPAPNWSEIHRLAITARARLEWGRLSACLQLMIKTDSVMDASICDGSSLMSVFGPSELTPPGDDQATREDENDWKDGSESRSPWMIRDEKESEMETSLKAHLCQVRRLSEGHSFLETFVRRAPARVMATLVRRLWLSLMSLLRALVENEDGESVAMDSDVYYLILSLLIQLTATVSRVETFSKKYGICLIDPRLAPSESLTLQNETFATSISQVFIRYLAPLVNYGKMAYTGQSTFAESDGEMLGVVRCQDHDWLTQAAVETEYALGLVAFFQRSYFLTQNICDQALLLHLPPPPFETITNNFDVRLDHLPVQSTSRFLPVLRPEASKAIPMEHKVPMPLAIAAENALPFCLAREPLNAAQVREAFFETIARIAALSKSHLDSLPLIDTPIERDNTDTPLPVSMEAGIVARLSTLYHFVEPVVDGHEVHRSDQDSSESGGGGGDGEFSSDDGLSESSSDRSLLLSSSSSIKSDSEERSSSDNPTLIDAVITTSEEESDSSSVDIQSHTIAFRAGDPVELDRSSENEEVLVHDSSSFSVEVAASTESLNARQGEAPGAEANDDTSVSPVHVSFRNLRNSPVPLSLRARSALGTEETSYSSGANQRCSSASRRARSRSSTSLSVQFRPRRLGHKSHLADLRTKQQVEAATPMKPAGRDGSDHRLRKTHGDTLRLGVGLWHPAVRLGTIVRKLGQVGGEAIKVGGLLWDNAPPPRHKRQLSADNLRHPMRTNHLTQSVMTIPDDQLLHDVLDGYQCSSGDDDCQEPTPTKLIVRCPSGHRMKKCCDFRLQWRCDAFEDERGCLSGKFNFRFRPGDIRWQCARCDVDYCSTCFRHMRSRLRRRIRDNMQKAQDRLLRGCSDEGIQVQYGGFWWLIPAEEVEHLRGGMTCSSDGLEDSPLQERARGRSVDFTTSRRRYFESSVTAVSSRQAIESNKFVHNVAERLRERTGLLSLIQSLLLRGLRVSSQWKLGLLAQNAVITHLQSQLRFGAPSEVPRPTTQLLRSLEAWTAGRPSLRSVVADVLICWAKKETCGEARPNSTSATEFVITGLSKAILRQSAVIIGTAHMERVAERKAAIERAVECMEALAQTGGLDEAEFAVRKARLIESVVRNKDFWPPVPAIMASPGTEIDETGTSCTSSSSCPSMKDLDENAANKQPTETSDCVSRDRRLRFSMASDKSEECESMLDKRVSNVSESGLDESVMKLFEEVDNLDDDLRNPELQWLVGSKIRLCTVPSASRHYKNEDGWFLAPYLNDPLPARDDLLVTHPGWLPRCILQLQNTSSNDILADAMAIADPPRSSATIVVFQQGPKSFSLAPSPRLRFDATWLLPGLYKPSLVTSRIISTSTPLPPWINEATQIVPMTAKELSSEKLSGFPFLSRTMSGASVLATLSFWTSHQKPTLSPPSAPQSEASEFCDASLHLGLLVFWLEYALRHPLSFDTLDHKHQSLTSRALETEARAQTFLRVGDQLTEVPTMTKISYLFILERLVTLRSLAHRFDNLIETTSIPPQPPDPFHWRVVTLALKLGAEAVVLESDDWHTCLPAEHPLPAILFQLISRTVQMETALTKSGDLKNCVVHAQSVLRHFNHLNAAELSETSAQLKRPCPRHVRRKIFQKYWRQRLLTDWLLQVYVYQDLMVVITKNGQSNETRDLSRATNSYIPTLVHTAPPLELVPWTEIKAQTLPWQVTSPGNAFIALRPDFCAHVHWSFANVELTGDEELSLIVLSKSDKSSSVALTARAVTLGPWLKSERVTYEPEVEFFSAVQSVPRRPTEKSLCRDNVTPSTERGTVITWRENMLRPLEVDAQRISRDTTQDGKEPSLVKRGRSSFRRNGGVASLRGSREKLAEVCGAGKRSRKPPLRREAKRKSDADISDPPREVVSERDAGQKRLRWQGTMRDDSSTADDVAAVTTVSGFLRNEEEEKGTPEGSCAEMKSRGRDSDTKCKRQLREEVQIDWRPTGVIPAPVDHAIGTFSIFIKVAKFEGCWFQFSLEAEVCAIGKSLDWYERDRLETSPMSSGVRLRLLRGSWIVEKNSLCEVSAALVQPLLSTHDYEMIKDRLPLNHLPEAFLMESTFTDPPGKSIDGVAYLPSNVGTSPPATPVLAETSQSLPSVAGCLDESHSLFRVDLNFSPGHLRMYEALDSQTFRLLIEWPLNFCSALKADLVSPLLQYCPTISSCVREGDSPITIIESPRTNFACKPNARGMICTPSVAGLQLQFPPGWSASQVSDFMSVDGLPMEESKSNIDLQCLLEVLKERGEGGSPSPEKALEALTAADVKDLQGLAVAEDRTAPANDHCPSSGCLSVSPVTLTTLDLPQNSRANSGSLLPSTAADFWDQSEVGSPSELGNTEMMDSPSVECGVSHLIAGDLAMVDSPEVVVDLAKEMELLVERAAKGEVVRISSSLRSVILALSCEAGSAGASETPLSILFKTILSHYLRRVNQYVRALVAAVKMVYGFCLPPWPYKELGFALLDVMPHMQRLMTRASMLPALSDLLFKLDLPPRPSQRRTLLLSAAIEEYFSGDVNNAAGESLSYAHPALELQTALQHLIRLVSSHDHRLLDYQHSDLPKPPPTAIILKSLLTDAKRQAAMVAESVSRWHAVTLRTSCTPPFAHHLGIRSLFNAETGAAFEGSPLMALCLQKTIEQSRPRRHRHSAKLLHSTRLAALHNALLLPTRLYKTIFLGVNADKYKLILLKPPPLLQTTGRATLVIDRQLRRELSETEALRHSTLEQLMDALDCVRRPTDLCGTQRPVSLILRGESAHDLGGPFLEVSSEVVNMFQEYFLTNNPNAEAEMGFNRDIPILSPALMDRFDLHAFTWPARHPSEQYNLNVDRVVDLFKQTIADEDRITAAHLHSLIADLQQVIRHKQITEETLTRRGVPLSQLAIIDSRMAKIFSGLGVLIAACAASGCPVNLTMAAPLWRMLAAEEITWEDVVSTETHEGFRALRWKEALSQLESSPVDEFGRHSVEAAPLWESISLDCREVLFKSQDGFHPIVPLKAAVLLNAIFNSCKELLRNGQKTQASIPSALAEILRGAKIVERANSEDWTAGDGCGVDMFLTLGHITRADLVKLCTAIVDEDLVWERSARLTRRLVGLRFIQGGFDRFMPQAIAHVFTRASDIELIACGTPQIDVPTIKANTDVRHDTDDEEIIKWLWDILEDWSPEKRRLFLRFVSGISRFPHSWRYKDSTALVRNNSSRRGWRFEIRILRRCEFGDDDEGDLQDRIDERLPTATTCFQTLKIPPYSSREVLEDKLGVAVTVCSDIDLDDEPLMS